MFSSNLKRIRKEHNLSQEQLADKLGVSRQSVSKWESGSAYPEMDKVLQICKMFDLNIDELLNQDLKKIEESKQSKSNINKYIDDFLEFVSKTVDMFNSMDASQIIKCLFEQAIVIIILSILLGIITAVCGSFLDHILRIFTYNRILIGAFDIVRALIELIAFIFGIVIFLHIFKTRYLDYYEVTNDEKQDKKEEKEIKKETITLKKEKVVIRDPEHSNYKFISGILKALLICLKCFVGFVSIGFCFSLIGFVIALVVSLLFVKTGTIFIGTLLILVSCIVINLLILYIVYNFIVDKKNNLKITFISFITSLIVFGIGVGLCIISVKDFKYIEDLGTKDEKTIAMSDNLLIHPLWSDEINYIEEDRDDLKIVVEHSKANISDIKVTNEEENSIVYVNLKYKYYDNSTYEIKRFIDDVNNKKIVNYGIYKVTIYTSKNNIEKLKENYKKWNENNEMMDDEE